MRIKNSFFAPLLVLAIYILLFASGFISTELLQYKDNIYLSLIVIQLVIFILPAIFYCRIKGEGYFKRLRLLPFSPSKIPFLVTSLLVLFFGSALIKLGLYHLGVGGNSFSLYNTYYLPASMSIQDILYILLTFALLPAITEEFIFRSILLAEYEENGIFCAVLMSSLSFAMLHFDFSEFPIYLFGGVIFALTAIITRSVFASIIIHTANNILGMFLGDFLTRFIEQPQSEVFYTFSLIILFMLSLFIFLSGAERIYYIYGINGIDSPPDYELEESKPKLLFEALVAPTFLFCVLVYFVASLLS